MSRGSGMSLRECNVVGNVYKFLVGSVSDLTANKISWISKIWVLRVWFYSWCIIIVKDKFDHPCSIEYVWDSKYIGMVESSM